LFSRFPYKPRVNRNFEVFTPAGFLAAITRHISDEGAQLPLPDSANRQTLKNVLDASSDQLRVVGSPKPDATTQT
jgi:hypothetical protein